MFGFINIEFSEFRALTYGLSLVMGIGISLLLTPLVRRLAIRINFVDRPGGRKIQAKPVALGGGIAVFGATIITIICAYLFADFTVRYTFFGNDSRMLTGLLIASAATLLLGLYDDVANLRGRYKLLGQLLITGLLVYIGFRIENFTLFGRSFELGWMVIPFSMFWLVGSTNAINLLDGIDGLASSLGMVLCLTFAAINGYYGHFPETIVMLALAGALLGFLRYNFAPASIYLGDAGSMVIGLVIGSIAVQTHCKTPAFIAMVIPVAVWSIPIFDSVAAVLRRRLTGRSIFAPDRGHLHHSLLTRGWSVRQASLFISLICATTCLSAVLGVIWKSEWIVVATVVAVIIFLISTKTFGHIEFALLRERFRQHGLAFRSDETNHSMPRHGTVRLQGSHEWERLWESLVESADSYSLTKLQLTIHMPAVHEAFYANWKAPKNKSIDSDTLWKMTHPLMIEDEVVGKLDIAGIADGTSSSTTAQISNVLEFLEPIEEDLCRIRTTLREQRLTKKKSAEVEQGSESSSPAPVDAKASDQIGTATAGNRN